MSERIQGKVKFFNPEKGFGFILPDDGGADVFVHASVLDGQGLNEDDRVEYEIKTGRNGKNQADKVKVLK